VAAASEEPVIEAKPTSRRVLIVDDEEVVRNGCQRSLETVGYRIDTAASGQEGVAHLEDETYDVVLLDLVMPDMDGMQVLEWIREHRPEIPVIVITGFATVAKAVGAMRAGAFDFIGKPFTPDYLRIVVNRAFERRQLVAEAQKLREEKALDLYTIVQEQSRLRTVFNCMGGAVLVTNRNGEVVLHNPAALRLLRLARDTVIGRPFAASVHDGEAAEMVIQVMRDSEAVTREFHPGAISPRYLRACCAPVRTPSGKLVGSVTLFEDITEQKKIDRMKSEFVATVAHDLRSPLASIQQLVWAVQSCADENRERRRQLLERIDARLTDQLTLAGRLLDLCKLEAGEFPLELRRCSGKPIVRDAIELCQPRADAKQILLVHQPLEETWWIKADQAQIREVFLNLIDNAVKYTPANGRVTVAESVCAQTIVVEIADTGLGIEQQDLPYIFDSFFRSTTEQIKTIGGCGLGLSIAKRVAVAHGGHIEVASEPGRGSRFSVHLPLMEFSL
jgi:two-component system phosphate regulon sensor histidine kinase PhoR